MIKLDLCSESMTLNIQRETIEAMSHFLEFIYSYSLLEILTHFKPRIRPQLHSFEKSLNRSIIKEWFELAIWFNRLKAYRDAQKLELIENSLLLSTHLDSVTQRPKIMKSVNKLIDSPWHIAFHMSFMYLKLLICEEWQKVLEIQIEEPVIDLAINQTPHTLSMHMKTEALQIIALETQEFEPERYEVPFTIPTFEKNSTKKKIFDGKPDNLNKVHNFINFL